MTDEPLDALVTRPPSAEHIARLIEVAAAALYWHARCVRAAKLKRERNDTGCQFEQPFSQVGQAAVRACWTMVHEESPLAESAWCQPCRDRELTHQAYRESVGMRGAALRRFRRVASGYVALVEAEEKRG